MEFVQFTYSPVCILFARKCVLFCDIFRLLTYFQCVRACVLFPEVCCDLNAFIVRGRLRFNVLFHVVFEESERVSTMYIIICRKTCEVKQRECVYAFVQQLVT